MLTLNLDANIYYNDAADGILSFKKEYLILTEYSALAKALKEEMDIPPGATYSHNWSNAVSFGERWT